MVDYDESADDVHRRPRVPAREMLIAAPGRRPASGLTEMAGILATNFRRIDMHNETWYDRTGGELVLSVREKPNNAWGGANAAPIYKDGQGHVMQTPGREFLVHPKTKKQYWRTQG